MSRGGSWIHPSTRWSLYLQAGFTCERCARALLPGRKLSKRGASIHHAAPTSRAAHGVVLCMQCNAALGEPTRLVDVDDAPDANHAASLGLYVPPWHSGWLRTLDARPLGRALARWHRGGARGPWRRHLTSARGDDLARLATDLLTRRLRGPGNLPAPVFADLCGLARGHCSASECAALWPFALREFVALRRSITRSRVRDAWTMLDTQGTGHKPPYLLTASADAR